MSIFIYFLISFLTKLTLQSLLSSKFGNKSADELFAEGTNLSSFHKLLLRSRPGAQANWALGFIKLTDKRNLIFIFDLVRDIFIRTERLRESLALEAIDLMYLEALKNPVFQLPSVSSLGFFHNTTSNYLIETGFLNEFLDICSVNAALKDSRQYFPTFLHPNLLSELSHGKLSTNPRISQKMGLNIFHAQAPRGAIWKAISGIENFMHFEEELDLDILSLLINLDISPFHGYALIRNSNLSKIAGFLARNLTQDIITSINFYGLPFLCELEGLAEAIAKIKDAFADDKQLTEAQLTITLLYPHCQHLIPKTNFADRQASIKKWRVVGFPANDLCASVIPHLISPPRSSGEKDSLDSLKALINARKLELNLE